jgi:glycerophosphoryl diester phosphodiesterase
VWTVHEPALVDRLVKWDVNGIITDRPGTVRARLGR